MDYGARIERGEVVEVLADGCAVRSLDRPGVITPPLAAVSGTYARGQRVLFFLFDDGTGRILCAL